MASTLAIMKKEGEGDIRGRSNQFPMSSAVSLAGEISDGYVDATGAFHPGGQPPYSSGPPTLTPMGPYFQPHSQPNRYPNPPAHYFVPAHGFAPHPAPPPHPQHHYQAPQQLHYGSWPGSSPPLNQQVHFGSYPILPPQAQGLGLGPSVNNNPGQYGALEFNVRGMEGDNLASVLHYVKRNPHATLFDVEDLIPDIATADEMSSRFVQKRLKVGGNDEKQVGVTAAIQALDDLWPSGYGNYMLQAIFEFGTASMKDELMDALYDRDVVNLCLHMHGCRVIQKAIRFLKQEHVCTLIKEFHDKVVTFIHDPHGNHVIQRCVQVMSSFAKCAMKSDNPELASSLSDQMQFIIDDIVANVETLSTHRYGCRVVQRAIEHCVEEQKTLVLDEVISCHKKLVVDQYGNYVAQQALICGSEAHQTAIVDTLTEENESLLALARHKYASNVVEAVLVHGRPQHKDAILEQMLRDTREEGGEGYCCVIELAKDPIANYVVNKAIEVSEGDQKKKFLEVISSSRQELSKSPYAKYVLQRISKLETVQEKDV